MITLFCIRPIGFNIGNDAIFIGVINRINQAFGQVVNLITIPATSRYETHGRAGLTSKTIHEINQYGHGVIVGGGNLYENGELDIDMEALAKLEVPLMLFSLSRGRIYNRDDKLVDRTDVMPDQVIRRLNQASSISVCRDKATIKYLNELGVEAVELGGCPTIFCDSMAHRLPQVAPRDEGNVLLSLRNPTLMNISLQRQMSIYSQVVEIIALLKRRNLGPVRLLCHDHRDIPFAASFAGVDYVYTSDVWTYLSLLKSCALNVTFRVHSALPCMALGAPFINITYDERGLSLLDTVGFGDWNLNLLDHNDLAAGVSERLDALGCLDEHRKASKPIWQRLQSVQTEAFANFANSVYNFAAKSMS